MPDFHHLVFTDQSGAAAVTGIPILYGPYVVDYTDIPHDGDKKTLWTPQVGDVLLRLVGDWATATAWDHGALFVGQNVDGTGQNKQNVLAEIDMTMPPPGGVLRVQLSSIDPAFNGTIFDGAGDTIYASAVVFHTTDPVQIQLAQTGGSNPTAGHVELFALIARAVAPS
jgi:hypothetical protein